MEAGAGLLDASGVRYPRANGAVVRRPLAIVMLVLAGTFAALGGAPVARAATARTPAKVVIVVGATHGTTPTYRKYADAAYAEAIKYTPNVVKVYSPNATWSRVKAAAVGASILIYFGHGNGWPSPYTYDPQYTTKDGMGLNADLNGDGKLSDYENKYYGEPYMRSLDLAPNAIVLLHNLCYASGNSEPGNAQPTVGVARQRISNYAAGFLASNAQAVIADGHRGPADYIRALFTTDQTIEQLWRTAPGNNGHVSSFTSTRTSGVRALMDPEGTSSGFYRSLVTQPTLTTSMVVGTVDTSRDPATLQVPGRASARVADAPSVAVHRHRGRGRARGGFTAAARCTLRHHRPSDADGPGRGQSRRGRATRRRHHPRVHAGGRPDPARRPAATGPRGGPGRPGPLAERRQRGRHDDDPGRALGVGGLARPLP